MNIMLYVSRRSWTLIDYDVDNDGEIDWLFRGFLACKLYIIAVKKR